LAKLLKDFCFFFRDSFDFRKDCGRQQIFRIQETLWRKLGKIMSVLFFNDVTILKGIILPMACVEGAGG